MLLLGWGSSFCRGFGLFVYHTLTFLSDPCRASLLSSCSHDHSFVLTLNQCYFFIQSLSLNSLRFVDCHPPLSLLLQRHPPDLVLTFTRKVVKQARVTAPPLPFQHAVFNTTPAAANTTNRSHPITTRAAATTTTAALDVEEDGYRGCKTTTGLRTATRCFLSMTFVLEMAALIDDV